LLHAQAQPDTLWTKCLGGSSTDRAFSIQQTNDGGYIVAGISYSADGDVYGSHGDEDAWVVKLDAEGYILWTNCLGGIDDDGVGSIWETSDGGYVVAGLTGSTDGDVNGNHGGYADAWVVKLDAVGDTLWTKCLGGSEGDGAASIQQTSDGGYVVAGYTQSTDGDVHGNHGGLYDAWVVKLAAARDTLWTKCLGGSQWDHANNIQQTIDGGYVVAGHSRSTDGDVHGNHGNSDAWVVKLDAAGDTLWTKCVGGSGNDEARCIQQTSDGGYVVAGHTWSTDGDVNGNHGSLDAWVMKLDAVGDTLWTKCLGGSNGEGANSILQTNDGEYLVAGWTSSIDGDVHGIQGGISDVWVVRLDDGGDTLWTKCLGGSQWDLAFAAQQTSAGGFVLAGWTESTNGDVHGNHSDNGADAWIVKLGMDEVGLSEMESLQFTISPNPTTNAFTLQLARTVQALPVSLLDATGRLVQTHQLNTTGPIILDLSGHENGLYLVQVRFDDGSTATQRVVKQ